MAYAKTFWQSVQLQPPMESRLVSSHMNQRLKVAPQGHQSVNVTYKGMDEPPQLKQFFAKTSALQSSDETEKIRRYASLIDHNQRIFAQQKQSRIDRDKIHTSINSGRKYATKKTVTNSSEDVMKDIEEFEQQLGL